MPHASTEQLTAGNYHTRKLLLPSSNGREAPPILAEGSAQVYFARPIRNFRSGSWAGRVLRSHPGTVIVGLTRSHEFGLGHHDTAPKRAIQRDPNEVIIGM